MLSERADLLVGLSPNPGAVQARRQGVAHLKPGATSQGLWLASGRPRIFAVSLMLQK